MKPAPGSSTKLEKATLGAGCFWCVEAVFQRIKGVASVMPGYTGGTTKSPTYKQVCSGMTGHAEVAQIEFDPAVVSYETILEVFWKSHDPTTLNKQGADEGTQYRSAIFTHSEAQKKAAEASKAALEKAGVWIDPIVTEITPLTEFYAAEDYHRDYYNRNPNQGYCQFVIAPKVKKIEQAFKDLLKTK